MKHEARMTSSWERLRAIRAHISAIQSDGPFMDTLDAEGAWWSAAEPVLVALSDAIVAAAHLDWSILDDVSVEPEWATRKRAAIAAYRDFEGSLGGSYQIGADADLHALRPSYPERPVEGTYRRGVEAIASASDVGTGDEPFNTAGGHDDWEL